MRDYLKVQKDAFSSRVENQMMKRKLLNLFYFTFPIILQLSAQTNVEIQRADSLYEAGKDYYYDGDYKTARTIFEEVLDIRNKHFRPTEDPVLKTYHRLGKCFRRLRLHHEALEVYLTGLQYAKKAEQDRTLWLGDYYAEIGVIYDQMFDLKNSIECYEKSIKYYTKLYGEESRDVADIYLNIGYSHTKKGFYKSAEKALKKALSIYQKTDDPDSKSFNRVYNNLSIYYYYTEDYEKALEYSKNALRIKLKNYEPDHPSVAKYHVNVALAYEGLGAYEEGLKHSIQAANITRKSLGDAHSETATAQEQVADFYSHIGQYDKALSLYKKALYVMENHIGADHPSALSVNSSIGDLFNKRGNYEEALRFYRNSIKKYKKRGSDTQTATAENYYSVAEVLLNLDSLDSALHAVGTAMEYASSKYHFKQEKAAANPPINSVFSYTSYLYLLELKAEIFQKKYQKSQKIEDLKSAEISYASTRDLIDKMRRSYPSDRSREALNIRISPLLQKAVKNAFDLWELTGEQAYLLKALNYSEMSKASVLWQNMNTNFARRNSGIPENILQDLDKLRHEIADKQEQILDGLESEERDQLSAEIFSDKIKYEQKIADLEQHNKTYFKLKFATPQVDLSKLQKRISGDRTLLTEYFYDKTNLYIFTVESSGLSAVRIPLSKDFFEAVRYIRDFDLTELTDTEKAKNENYIQVLQKLYSLLIKPIDSKLSDKDKLVFVPHGILSYLPFSILHEKNSSTDFRKLPYLLKNHQIHYAWSLAFYGTEINSAPKIRGDFRGFAPSFKQQKVPSAYRANLSELPRAKEETENALKYFKGSIFSDSLASVNNFRLHSQQASILHLATHARVDDQFPLQSGLYFSGSGGESDFLSLYEIYNMRIPAQLAVMSACDTGKGKISEGEGIISLGRAFSYAGCASVIMSLWQANDQSTSDLMSLFYQELAEGKAKDQALRQAKLRYLEQADPLTAHPYFWAGMVAVGEMQALNHPRSPQSFLMWVGILLLISGGLFYFYRKRK